MAHRIELPVEFRFEIEPVRYVPGTVRLLKWLDGGASLGWAVSAPQELAGLRCDLSHNGISPYELTHQVQQQLGRRGRALSPSAKKIDIDCLLCICPTGFNLDKPPKARPIDPWQLRNDFLHLKRSSEALLNFLNRYGQWSLQSRPKLNLQYHSVPGIVLETGIWQRQAVVRDALKGDPGEWVKTHGFRFRSQSTFPHFVHVANDCFSCIIDSITIDFLRKIPFRICKRSDCGTPFAADRRGKQYCSQYCAHLVSLRKARKELKKRAVNEARL